MIDVRVQERAARLERLRRAATAMAQRGSAGCASDAETILEHMLAHLCAWPLIHNVSPGLMPKGDLAVKAAHSRECASTAMPCACIISAQVST